MDTHDLDQAIVSARELLAERTPVIVFTGAGMSADAGVPTFIGEGSVWRGRQITDILTPEAYKADPRFVWDWHLEMRSLLARVARLEAHQRLADWSRENEDVHVITQNIDGLHERAGQQRLIRLHGSVWYNQCAACKHVVPDDTLQYTVLPRCPRCRDGRQRPHVVWYGEPLEKRVYKQAEKLVAKAKILLVVGTSGRVYPAARLIADARSSGATIVDINPFDSFIKSDVTIRLGAQDAFERLFE